MGKNTEPRAQKIEYNEEEEAFDEWAVYLGRKVKKEAYKKRFNDESF